MKLLITLGAVAAAAAAQPPDIAAIMERVGRNQSQSQEARKDYTYHQKQLLRMNRGNGKVAREERREYDVSPNVDGVEKVLAHFEGKYESKGKYVPYDHPGYEYKDMDIDGDLINDLSEDMTNDKHSRDGIGCDLFPLTAKEQPKYRFELKGTEQYRGREVYRVKFEPKPRRERQAGPTGPESSGEPQQPAANDHKVNVHVSVDDHGDGDAAWKGEALIDAREFQPVWVQTSLAFKIPMGVKILLGTDVKGLGFSVSYQKFEDGIWFPVSYGGEFEVRAVFFYKRKISVSMTNAEFHRTRVSSNVKYVIEE